MFDRVGLQVNVVNMVGMVFLPYQTAGTQSEAAYERRMTGEGLTYQERQRVRVKCSDCGKEMAVGFMAVHKHTQNRIETGVRRHWETPTPYGEPQTYRMNFPTAGAPQEFPVEGRRGQKTKRTSMRVKLLNRHVRDTLIILE